MLLGFLGGVTALPGWSRRRPKEHLVGDVTGSVEAVEGVRPVELSADLLDQLIGQPVDRARDAGGLQLTGEGGLLQ